MNELKTAAIEEGFVFNKFQMGKRELTEECLIISRQILAYLVGNKPTPNREPIDIDCFMSDLLSERETLDELHNNLMDIMRYLGA